MLPLFKDNFGLFVFAQKVPAVSCFKLLLSCFNHDYNKFMIHDLSNGMLTESVVQ
jgi:hypothetical protein